ncbi:hypothetical protein DAETH_16210 [Deinococcus aetherius]|uniref:Uncharacterized protein n=1 Tax=Deinococcus aetherius TaxID=200252 RepID=A0ABM8ADE3_9DEIO|nr:hypothetical protein [Deinococcus aetherius]BDP41652.1 hypothetical protein DAETH_16210 [Deinococcus aetherius]
MSIGAAYLDHYQRYLRDSNAQISFEVEGKTVKVLDFAHAMKDAHIMASLGLSHFRQELGEVCEVVVPVSEGDDIVMGAVAASLSFLLHLKTGIERVSYLRHLHRSMPAFYKRYRKTAIAFVEPYPFPEGFARVELDTANRD